MKFHRSSSPILALVLADAGVLAGCTGKTADESLASAKSYLAKNDQAAAIIELKNALQSKPDSAEARFLLGKALLEHEEAVAAAVELRKASDLKYPQDKVIPLLAKALLGSGEARKVVELDNTTALTAPESVADFKTTVALAQAAVGNAAKADAAADAALKSNPDYAPALLYRARSLAAQRDVDGAMKIVDGVLAKFPDDSHALAFKGDLIAYTHKDDDQATAMYRKALAADPRDLPAFGALLERLLSRNDLDGARTQLDAMKKLRPHHPVTVYFESRLALAKGDSKTADELAQQLLKAAPNNVRFVQLAGIIALQRGQWLVAEDHLGKLVQFVPQAPMPRQLLAQAFLRGGEPAKAIDTLEPLLESSPDARTLSLAGSASLMTGDTKKAEELLGRAAKLDPADKRSRRTLALARMAGGDAAGGLADLQALASSDSSTEADLALIAVYLNRRDIPAALAAIDKLEQKTPGKPVAPHLRAQALALKGDLTGARASYEKALADDPNFFPSIDGLAALDVRENKPDAARARFDAVLKRNPDDVRAMVALAVLDERAGKPKQEVTARLSKAVPTRPTDPSLRRQLVQYHLGKRDFKLALNAAQDAASALPNDAGILAMLAATQLAAADTNQSIASYNKLVAMRPKSPLPLLGLADAYIAAKSYPQAADAVKKAAALAPGAPAIVGKGVQIDMLAGQPDAALAKARAEQARSPKTGYGYLLEGDIEASRRNWAAATPAYRAALQREPNAGVVAQRLYAALRATDDHGAKADTYAAEWMKTHPSDSGFQFFLAGVSIADHKYEQAEAQLKQVLRLSPDNAAALNNLAWVLSTQKKTGALEPAERANQLAPNQPMFMDTLAMVLAEQGQVARALELQKKAVEMDGAAPGLRLRLARLYAQSGDKSAARKELDELAKLGDKFPQQAEVRELRAQL